MKFCDVALKDVQAAQRTRAAAAEVRVEGHQETSPRSAVVPRGDRTRPGRAGHEHGRTRRRQVFVSAEIFISVLYHFKNLYSP